MSTSLFPGVALVTGAASGIGRSIAISFAREGCHKIAICDRNEAGLEETSKLIENVDGKVKVLVYKVDMIQASEIEGMVSKTVAEFGRLDYGVNAAGIGTNGKPSTSTSLEQFDMINSVNYRGCWLSSRAELAQMMKQEPLPTHDGRPGNRGSIVNIASQLAIAQKPGAAAYCGSKAGVLALTRCDAIDYSEHNIRVNCVCPGVIATPMTEGTPEEMKAIEPFIALAPLNRKGTPQEIADAVLFLSSSKATFMQGAAMVVDGGYTIN